MNRRENELTLVLQDGSACGSSTHNNVLLTIVQDGNLDIIYINEKLNRDDWHTFEVGQTRFNDQALRKAGT